MTKITSTEQCALGTAALSAIERFVDAAQAAVSARVIPDGCDTREKRIDPTLLEREQRAAHGFAWIAAYGETFRAIQDWANALDQAGRFGTAERAIHALIFAEYGAQLVGGLPISQSEFIRPQDLGLQAEALALSVDPDFAGLQAIGFDPATRLALSGRVLEGDLGATGIEDETLLLIQDQFDRFAADHVLPQAQQWHLDDALIPETVIDDLAELGLFGMTIPEAWGGLGLDKLTMCIATERLSAASLGVGSLGTRAEIAGELIAQGGTEAQKARFLPGIASGAILPTAVFTEPDIGSDLAHLKTRAARDGAVYRVTGAKTWITHGARADLMTLLVRTDPDKPDHRGLSMLLAEKPRGTVEDPFPAPGMAGSEISTLGYRGMKEYDIGFDGFEVPAENLLGGVEGEGFRQLMATFEAARIQTAARAVGVAENALRVAADYAQQRRQFGKPLSDFPRVSDKLAMMVAELVAARQLTLRAARIKDQGRRSDVEAGMAKLLAARVAWANADSALQIHGGAGYAEVSPISRILVDARILNIFEGAAEIQAHVIARGLLSQRN